MRDEGTFQMVERVGDGRLLYTSEGLGNDTEARLRACCDYLRAVACRRSLRDKSFLRRPAMVRFPDHYLPRPG